MTPRALVLAGLLFSSSALAQDWNRATFRGDELEGRDFEFTDIYFLDVLTFLPSASMAEVWNRSDNGLLWTGGSVRTDELYFHNELRLRQPLGDRGFFLRFGWLQAEDFDSRFQRIRVGFEQAVLPGTSLSLLFDGTQLKQDNDLTLGIVHERSHWRVESSFTAVDFNEDKGREGREFDRDPYAAHLAVDWSPSLRWSAGITLDTQLPMELVEPAEDRRFTFRKTQATLRSSIRLSRRDRLDFTMPIESTSRQRESLAGDEGIDEDREVYWPGAEWRRFHGQGLETAVGLRWFRLRESDRRRPDRTQEMRIDRREIQAFYRAEVPLIDRWWFSPALFTDWVHLSEEYPTTTERSDRKTGLLAKLALPFEWRPSPSIRIVINPTLSLTPLKFGGGNIQAVVTF